VLVLEILPYILLLAIEVEQPRIVQAYPVLIDGPEVYHSQKNSHSSAFLVASRTKRFFPKFLIPVV